MITKNFLPGDFVAVRRAHNDPRNVEVQDRSGQFCDPVFNSPGRFVWNVVARCCILVLEGDKL